MNDAVFVERLVDVAVKPLDVDFGCRMGSYIGFVFRCVSCLFCYNKNCGRVVGTIGRG